MQDASMRQRLVEEYHAAVKAYSEAVRQLNTESGNNFDGAYRRVEEARAACEASRKAWLKFEKKPG